MGTYSFAFVVLVACVAVYAKMTYTALLDSNFNDQLLFLGRTEYLMLLSLPAWVKKYLKNAPFLAHEVRSNLDVAAGGVARAEWYDPAKHDRSYRALKTGILTDSECIQLRNIIQRNSLEKSKTYQDIGDNALYLEFDNMTPLRVLGLGDRNAKLSVAPGDKELVSQVFHRVQKIVEETFNSTSIFLEFADLTKRTTPKEFSSRWSYLYYLSTGGHGVHSDMCSWQNTPEAWKTSFSCHMKEQHCCAHRTHSVLLYINTDEDELVGGDFYMVDRHDIGNGSQPSFSGPGLGKLLQNTLKVQPKCGKLMMFTSDARNIHGVFPIRSGARYAMPMWFADIGNLPWHEEQILEKHLNEFWDIHSRERCPSMGSDNGVTAPSMFQKYVGDCDAMLAAMKEFAYGQKEKQQRN